MTASIKNKLNDKKLSCWVSQKD